MPPKVQKLQKFSKSYQTTKLYNTASNKQGHKGVGTEDYSVGEGDPKKMALATAPPRDSVHVGAVRGRPPPSQGERFWSRHCERRLRQEVQAR